MVLETDTGVSVGVQKLVLKSLKYCTKAIATIWKRKAHRLSAVYIFIVLFSSRVTSFFRRNSA